MYGTPSTGQRLPSTTRTHRSNRKCINRKGRSCMGAVFFRAGQRRKKSDQNMSDSFPPLPCAKDLFSSMAVHNWTRVAHTPGEIPFGPNHIAEVRAGEKTICIGRHNDAYFAFAHKCPHAGGYFVNGFIDALGNVVCPLHRYKFAMKNGRNVTGEGYYLKHWPVEVREDGVYVGLDAKSSFWG